MPAGSGRILRHRLRARTLHAANALVLLILIFSGLAIGDRLPDWLVEGSGGHEALNDLHQWLGLAFIVTAALVATALWRGTRALVRELLRLRASDLAWPLAFLRHLLAPSRHPAPLHDGQLDPVERLVLAPLLLLTLLVAFSGVYLYVLPDAPLWVFLVAIRAHVYGAWLLIALLGIHVFAGLGILPTHRGIARSMFGDGTLPTATARRLWPGWTGRQLDKTDRSGSKPP